MCVYIREREKEFFLCEREAAAKMPSACASRPAS